MPRRSGERMYTVRSDFEANREVRRKAASGVLGVKRPLSTESAQEVRYALEQVGEMVRCEDQIFPSNLVSTLEVNHNDLITVDPLDTRTYFGLTYVQKRRVSKLLSNGFKGGYELHKATQGIEERTAASADRQLEVPLRKKRYENDSLNRKASWRGVGGNLLAMMLEEDPIIQREHQQTISVLTQLGLKGVDPERGFVEHIGLGDSRVRFSFDQKRAIADLMQDLLPDVVVLEPMFISTSENGHNEALQSVNPSERPPLSVVPPS